MEQNLYTLPELVDLSLRVPQKGAVNFNILHTVLTTIISELNLQKVRPWCQIENEQLARARIAKFKLQDQETRRIQSQQDLRHEHELLAPLRKAASAQSTEKQVEPETQGTDGAPLQTPGELLTILSGPKEQERRVEAGWDNVKQDLLEPQKTPQATEPSGTRKIGPLQDAWRYTHLRTKVDTNQEGLMRLTEIVDMIADKIKKAEERRKKGGGASIEELEGLEERVADLEEAREIFETDHETLERVVKVQNQMLGEFEDIKALGSQIKQMQVDLSSKAGMKEMEAALALKGDLVLVNTKVDQLEFETAIQELGESIGLLGLKFQRKCDEWEERAIEIWKAINGKMSRDVFDDAMAGVESRLRALTYGLTNLKQLVDEHVAPEASGAYRCIACRRPAEVSGKECIDAKVPKRPLKMSETSSEDSQGTESIVKMIKDAKKKKPKLEGPPYPDKKEATLSLPNRGATFRSSQDGAKQKHKPDIRMEPIDDTRYDDRHDSVPKLPDILSKNAARSSVRTNRSHYSVPKKNPRLLEHKKLVFTDKVLERMERERIERQNQFSFAEEVRQGLNGSQDESRDSTNDSTLNSSKDESQTSSKDNRSESDSMGIMSDSGKSMKFFAPTRFIKDPLRRGSMLQKSASAETQKPKLILSPLSTNASSSESFEARSSS